MNTLILSLISLSLSLLLAIMDVLGAVLTLLNIPLKSWSGMQSFLKGRGVKEDILNYDARTMTADIRKEVSK